jgi:hypothetical protein
MRPMWVPLDPAQDGKGPQTQKGTQQNPSAPRTM